MVRKQILLFILGPLACLAGGVAMSRSFAPSEWWAPGGPQHFPAAVDYVQPDGGMVRTLLADGPENIRSNAFFKAHGPDGRACVTCHQPANAMSISSASVQARWRMTNGRDPLFAAWDGSNCPNLPQRNTASHSLLLEHGLIRVQRPWPPARWNESDGKPDFEIAVVRDPTGCNSTAGYGPSAGNISVYRRPRPVANLKYLVAVGFAYDPKQGMPLPIDPISGTPMAGNILADNRAGTLELQMQDAGSSHLRMTKSMTPEERAQAIAFMMRIYAAQQRGPGGMALDADGAKGGPAELAQSKPGQLGSIGRPVWSEFEAWEKMPADVAGKLRPEEREYRASVARGARIFRDKTFLISDSAGINSPIGFGNPVRNSCVFCHNMSQMGNDVAPGQVDLGTTNQPFANPAPHLPLFRITCLGRPHPHYGRVIYTSDPGFALTTGRCADVGKITLQSMRGLGARAPYFSNGSARDLREVVDFYDRRYNIGYSEQEKRDLVNLMSAL